jgi:acyl-coenzyme A thioesterase PaaI-like protein
LELYETSGKEVFTKMVTEFAPYFDTIDPMFEDLRPGHAEVRFANTRKVQNHLGTVHAIAMCNAAELAAGTMTDVSLPENFRWIPIEMTVKYLKMAKTDLRVVADGSKINWSEKGNIVVPVTVYDIDDNVVFTASITMKISSKKRE